LQKLSERDGRGMALLLCQLRWGGGGGGLGPYLTTTKK
jgi:hypothetical protein